jgi:Protein of unknown function (DUF2635)
MATQKNIFIKPVNSKKVPYPQSRQFLRSDGAWVQPSTYWNRRIAQNDVAISTPVTTVESNVIVSNVTVKN